MPYKRRATRYVRRTKRRTSTPWYNRKYTPMEIATKALKTASALKSIINSEMLYNYDYSNYNPTSSGGVTSMVAISQGDGNLGVRTGNSILVKKIQYRYALSKHPTPTFDSVRIMMFVDNRQVADTAPAVTDVLNSANSKALLNIDAEASNRFTILYDQLHLLSSIGDNYRQDAGYIPLNHHVKFNGAATTDIHKGGIYLLYISDQPTNTPVLSLAFKVCYYDN